MSGKDDDSHPSDLDKWLNAQRGEIDQLRRQFQDSLDKELRSWRGDDNDTPSSSKGPFERFKSFVDSNVSTFSEGFKNFPSNIAELKERMQQEREARRQEEADVWRRWTGSNDSPDHIRLQVERANAEERKAVEADTRLLLRTAYERNRNVPPEKIAALYKDSNWDFGALDAFTTPMLSMGGACYYKTETVDNLPSTARWGWPSPKPQWLSVDWFKRSPYSPVRLEADPLAGEKWRAAFEDLLCATLDKPMMSGERVGQRSPYGKPQSTYYGPGLDWMLSLQCRGILPPQLPNLYKSVSLFDGFDVLNRPRTREFMHDMDQVTAGDKLARMYPLVQRDVQLLMDEVAIKSCPETQAEPLKILQSPWRVPDTEQDLYDEMPPYTDLVPMPAASNYTSPFVGYDDAKTDVGPRAIALRDAITANDLDAASNMLKQHVDENGQVEDLVYEAISSAQTDSLAWMQALDQAVVRSGITDRDPRWQRQMEKLSSPADEMWESRPPMATPISQGERKEKPDILSQLTTTHTTRMPDGTVITKVVLKQRFADGSEETQESVQESREQARPSKPLEEKAAGQQQQEPVRKKGWFWN
ncbi:hypothetical protein BDY17DRAFT_297192 [Neohortaea acidophila]|uniref:Uncharacterized protein n=1 Tax=Neohortaea acidophila TaxID=245834 RepID=A0A6A6PT74_9PEZI|nr:uncharacterized protein BDY17DRAFT_297192 [Neohortaea acidophila]KAF2483308.1 hypothetical protein BDY17DRAFT_297192 [Neohortaea acidophila]